MKTLLVNVDAPFNYAIRKIFNYGLQNGEDMEMRDIGLKGYPHNKKIIIDGSDYDRVMISNIFEVNKYAVTVNGCENVSYGGVGSREPMKTLPKEIDDLEPYYFQDEDTSYGFITRGCVRNCYFCKVPKTEGKLYKYREVEQIVQHKKVKFMDNNFLAYKNHLSDLEKLVCMGVKVDFNQGLDFRLVSDENLFLLSNLNYWGEYTFAFDDWRYLNEIERAVHLIKKYIDKPWKLKFYVYVNPNTMGIDTVRKRIEWLKRHESLPYIMRDAVCWDSQYKNYLIDLAAWCNQPGIFKKMDFEEFLSKRHTQKERIQESLEWWNYDE